METHKSRVTPRYDVILKEAQEEANRKYTKTTNGSLLGVVVGLGLGALAAKLYSSVRATCKSHARSRLTDA